MSFMFHPNPYMDPRAVNAVSPLPEEAVTFGALPVAKRIAGLFRDGVRRVALDGYAGVEFDVLYQLLSAQLKPFGVQVVRTESLLKTSEAIRALVAPSLPEDRAMDPVLMYGVRVERTYEDLFDAEKIAELQSALRNGTLLVLGPGALCAALRPLIDQKIWVDITPRTAAIHFKQGKAHNLGEPAALPFGEMMRRNYYVDFELAIDLRWELIRSEALDWYMAADDIENPAMLRYADLCRLYEDLRKRPLRCRPVYLEGVWGGHYIKRLRQLPDNMRNCAWVFDMIPMEVSLVATWNGHALETPFFTFIQQQGKKLLGAAAYEAFGGYFPIRFNYDDTFHSSGNMSIQCHPDAEFVVNRYGELGRQDESYYVCVAGENACTYLGFQDETSCSAFFNAAEKAQETGEEIDYRRYVHGIPSKPGTQVMIPAGTIHASGHNQVILEIGSLTVGSYTYKLYDYQRLDPLTGLPRPIHLEAGKQVIHPERTAEWVEANLVNHGGIVRKGDDWVERIAGEHDLLYFSLRTETFESEMTDDTQDRFHVLALTEGEEVRIEAMDDPSRGFTSQYLDVVVVPADFGPYRLINVGQGPVTVHKTLLKDRLEACSM